MSYRSRRSDHGIALVSVILVMALMTALLTGFYALVVADQLAGGFTRDQTQAYAVAHAGLEKLTADLGQLFTGGNFNPSAEDLAALEGDHPDFTGFTFESPGGASGYTIDPRPVVTQPIAAGPYQGLIGLITPYEINVTARALAAEVRMRREVQTIAVPVFQFGIYSENDLSFFAGPPFNFGGRVHTNQNIYLAQDGANSLTLEDRVTAVGEVVRTHLSNGLSIAASGHRGHVRMARAPGVYRNLTCGAMGGNCGSATQEGSVTVVGDTIPPSLQQVDADGQLVMVLQAPNTENEPTWTNLSMGTYAGYIRSGRTGARRLDLPLVSDGAAPIDIIRRPNPAAPDPPEVLGQRFFRMGSLRILLSDTAADITALPTVTPAPPVDLSRLNDPAYVATVPGLVLAHPIAEAGAAVGVSPAATAAEKGQGSGYLFPAGSPLVTGFLKIERQRIDETWQDVTVEILNLGFTARSVARGVAGGNGVFNEPEVPADAGDRHCRAANENPSPNAIIRLQRIRDNPSAAFMPCGVAAGVWSNVRTDYLPLALYDSREGARRDDQAAVGPQPPLLGGVMHYVEFDVNNFRRWLNGEIGASGGGSMDVTGYVLYFSDRRGNRNAANVETAEFGFEDFINTDAQSTPNGALDAGEDMNGNGALETYGGTPRVPIWNGVPMVPNYGGYVFAGPGNTPILSTALESHVVRVNPPLFFRRALKLVNGARGQLPSNGLQGLTVAAENPVYVQGDYNADNAGFGATGDGHVSAAVIADSVTFLSNSWNDIRSFRWPHSVAVTNPAPPTLPTGRGALTTWYRLGIIAGKGLSFPRPGNNPNDHTDFGTDGGAHNFIRYIENWGGQQLNYRGSIVSFYTSRQGVGTYKCCDVVYSPPTRGYRFDAEFLNPNLLPPRTPMFRDVNTLTFRQLLRPTQ
jgi:hypothetical protein